MTPPPITREARDWLLAQISGQFHFCRDEVAEIVKRMPLTPADPLDAVRARWQPTVRGFNVLILALHDGWIFGKAGLQPAVWDESDGRDIINDYHLQPLPSSPHAALIAEAHEAIRKCCVGNSPINVYLVRQLIGALEARDKT